MDPAACLTDQELVDLFVLTTDWTMWIAPLIVAVVGYFLGFQHARCRYELDIEDVS